MKTFHFDNYHAHVHEIDILSAVISAWRNFVIDQTMSNPPTSNTDINFAVLLHNFSMYDGEVLYARNAYHRLEYNGVTFNSEAGYLQFMLRWR